LPNALKNRSDIRRWTQFTLGVVLALAGCSGCDSSSGAPAGAWPSDSPEAKGFDSDALADIVEKIDREEMPVDSVLLVRDGALILDAYFYPYLGDQPHDTASVTKSVTSTLIGIAVDQDLLSLDQPVLAFFPDLAPPTTGSDPKDAIEMRHLLTMSSGLDCGRAPAEPELYQMLGSEHFVKYALELPMAAEPGEYFAYCSPGSHLLSAMLAEAADTSTGAFAAEHLFGPLGIEEFVWPTDPQGIERGWGDLQLFPHDMARIGHLVANGGLWNGVQVVSESWVEQATRSWIPAEVDGTGYGYQWWILAGAFDGDLGRRVRRSLRGARPRWAGDHHLAGQGHRRGLHGSRRRRTRRDRLAARRRTEVGRGHRAEPGGRGPTSSGARAGAPSPLRRGRSLYCLRPRRRSPGMYTNSSRTSSVPIVRRCVSRRSRTSRSCSASTRARSIFRSEWTECRVSRRAAPPECPSASRASGRRRAYSRCATTSSPGPIIYASRPTSAMT